MIMRFKKTPQLEAALKHWPRLKNRYFTSQLLGDIGPSFNEAVKTSGKRSSVCPDIKRNNLDYGLPTDLNTKLHKLGADMEKTLVELEDINEEVAKSKKILSDMLDDISTIRALVGPELNKYVQEVRSNRMAVEREAKSTLAEMKEIRKFFSDPKIQEDIKQMNEFVRAIYNLKALSDNNMLNAMVSTLVDLKKAED